MNTPELSWQQFRQLTSISKLPVNEQVAKYNRYIYEIQQSKIAILQHTLINQNKLGGRQVFQQEQEGLPSGCIEFVNNTSDGTECQFWIETSAPTNYTITWGDGETTTGVTTDDVDGGVGDGEGNNKLEVVYYYADSDTEYTARICFDDISLVTYLEFNGDD